MALPHPSGPSPSSSVPSANSVVTLSDQISPPIRIIIRPPLAQRQRPQRRYHRFQCYLLTTGYNYGNVRPVIALAQEAFPPPVARSRHRFPKMELRVKTPHRSIRNPSFANSLRITSLRIVYAQVPWNHILTQNPPGGGSQTLLTIEAGWSSVLSLLHYFIASLHLAGLVSKFQLQLFLTERGSRLPEHAP
jgi:hypothetical protein